MKYSELTDYQKSMVNHCFAGWYEKPEAAEKWFDEADEDEQWQVLGLDDDDYQEIELSDDVFAHLAKNRQPGESPNRVLHRLLKAATADDEEVVTLDAACPNCGENKMDNLSWSQEGATIKCETCDVIFAVVAG